MLIRHFIPIAVAIPALLAFGAQQTGFIPWAPIATLAVVGEILVLFQLEDHRLGRIFAEFGHAFKEAAHHHR
jgi:hypothetical protein